MVTVSIIVLVCVDILVRIFVLFLKSLLFVISFEVYYSTFIDIYLGCIDNAVKMSVFLSVK